MLRNRTKRHLRAFSRDLAPDDAFWRSWVSTNPLKGPAAETGRRRRLQWSFHPTKRKNLVGEVFPFLFWNSRGPVKANLSIDDLQTKSVTVFVPLLLAGWWIRRTPASAPNC